MHWTALALCSTLQPDPFNITAAWGRLALFETEKQNLTSLQYRIKYQSLFHLVAMEKNIDPNFVVKVAIQIERRSKFRLLHENKNVWEI